MKNFGKSMGYKTFVFTFRQPEEIEFQQETISALDEDSAYETFFNNFPFALGVTIAEVQGDN